MKLFLNHCANFREVYWDKTLNINYFFFVVVDIIYLKMSKFMVKNCYTEVVKILLGWPNYAISLPYGFCSLSQLCPLLWASVKTDTAIFEPRLFRVLWILKDKAWENYQIHFPFYTNNR